MIAIVAKDKEQNCAGEIEKCTARASVDILLALIAGALGQHHRPVRDVAKAAHGVTFAVRHNGRYGGS